MKKLRFVLLAALLCLLTACGENPPTLEFTLGEEAVAVEGQADEIIHKNWLGEVSAREICYEAPPQPVTVEVGEDGAEITLCFSCQPTQLTIVKEEPRQELSYIFSEGTLLLEPGCVYSIYGTFSEGGYTYKMTFGNIQTEDNAGTAESKEQMEENAHWDYAASIYLHGVEYTNTDDRAAELPEGYELLGSTVTEQLRWGENLWATFEGEVYASLDRDDLYAVIPWEMEFVRFEGDFAEAGSEYARYFRDNYGFTVSNGLDGDYFDFPWAEEADLTAELDAFCGAAAIPEIAGFESVTVRGLYREDGSLYGVEVCWLRENPEDPDNKSRLILRLYPEKPEDLGWARAHKMNYDRVTATKVDCGMVYGDGTEASVGRALDLVRDDGIFVQIVSAYGASLEEMGAVLDHYLRENVELAVFEPGESP